MELILKETIKKLGTLGQIVKVKPGFARNYLLRRDKAILATPDNVKLFETRKDELQKRELERLQQLENRAAKLNGVQIDIAVLASTEGKLYGSISITDIVEAMAALGHEITKQEVQLPHGMIRELGLYEIKLGLNHGAKEVMIAVNVIAKQ